MISYEVSTRKFEYQFKEDKKPLSITETFLTFIDKYELALNYFIKNGDINNVFVKYHIKPNRGKIFRNYNNHKIVHMK